MKRLSHFIPLIIIIALCLSITVSPVNAETGKDNETAIAVSQKEITLKVGETKTIEASVVPNTENTELLWYSSNGPVVSVDDKGTITALEKGDAEIRIRLRGQENVTTTVKVTVVDSEGTPAEKQEDTEEEPSQNVTLRDFSVVEKSVVIPAKGTAQLTITYTPENATDRPAWTSSDPSVVTVDKEGKLAATGIGSATVTGIWGLRIITVSVQVGFSDVPEDQYYYKPVYWALENGITGGMNATDFKPDSTCTRGQIMTFLWRINGSPEPDPNNNPFTDVTADRFFFKPVLWAYQSGMTAGTSATTFSPDAYCSRGQVVQFIWGCQKNKETRTVGFTDVKNSAYYYHAVKWAYHNGITAGTTKTTFGPNEACTRGQIVTFLYKCKDSKVDIYDKNKVAAFDDKAARVLDQVGWDLRSAFDWSAGLTYFGHNSEMPSDESPGIDWFADYGFDHHKGNCYVMACTFYRMARMMGYECYAISGFVPARRGGMTPHSWTEIVEDGTTYVYDPNFTNETGGNGFKITYGQSGTWRYADYHRMTK